MASSPVKSTKSLAFHESLIAYDFNYPERIPNQKLAVKEFVRVRVLDYSLPRQLVNAPDVRPTETELSPNNDELTGLWVGMRPSINYNIRRSQAEENISVNSNPGYQTIKHDLNALRVIARVNKSSTLYYCLGDQKHGLCTAYHIYKEDVFFFEEYRDDTATQGRLGRWAQKVRDTCKVQQGITQQRDDSLMPKAERSPLPDTDVDTSMMGSATDTTNGVLEETEPVKEEQKTILYKLVTSNTVLSLQECELAIRELNVSISLSFQEHITNRPRNSHRTWNKKL